MLNVLNPTDYLFILLYVLDAVLQKAFDFQVDKEEVCKKIITNTRMEAAPIPYYLFSRSTAGKNILTVVL